MKFLSLLVIVNLLMPTQVIFAGDHGTFGCSYSDVQECSKDNLAHSKIEHSNQYCSYLKAHDTACKQEAYSALAYTAAAAVCAAVCTASITGFGAGLGPLCNTGTQVVSIADAISSLYIATQVSSDIKDSQAGLQAAMSTASAVGMYAASSYMNTLGSATSAASQAAGQAGSAFRNSNLGTVQFRTNPVTGMKEAYYKEGNFDQNAQNLDQANKDVTDAQNKQASKEKLMACLQAGMNTLMASMKWINKSKLVDNAEEQLKNLQDVSQGSAPRTNFGKNQYKPMQTVVNGSAPAPDLSDSRGGVAEVMVPGGDSLARIGESYATAADGKDFGPMTKNDFGKAFQALKDNFGVTPQQMLGSLNSNGVAGTVGKLLGDSAGAGAMKDYLKDMENKARGMNLPSNLAFESSGGGSGGGSAKSDNPFGALFGDRGPAGINGGGAAGVNFGGFNGDIWHAGSTLSIFEIVSKKTNEVSARVKNR